MKHEIKTYRRLLAAVVALLVGSLQVCPVGAQAPAPPSPGAAAPPAATPPPPADDANALDPVTQELIDLLVKRKLLTRAEATALVDRARSRIEAEVKAESEAQAAEAKRRAEQGLPPVPAPGAIRVVYLSDVEKERIREELRKDVIAKAEAEGWARPGEMPAWVRRIEVTGDLNLRYELATFDSTHNVPAIDFQAINSGEPYNIDSGEQPPWLNTNEDRHRLRLRGRLAVAADVATGVRAELRLATGDDGNPVSSHETLSMDSADLGITLDRAFILYAPENGLQFHAGRMPNPFATTELVWDPDLSFDGLAVTTSTYGPFFALGAFSVGNTPFAFPSNRSQKVDSRDKWLFGAQLGTNLTLGGVTATVASSVYQFEQIEGERSSPCMTFSATDPCDTDHSRPGFIQQGNTLMALRDTQSGSDRFQYFGLASRFRELAALFRLDMPLFSEGVRAVLDVEGVANLEYDFAEVDAKTPVNNFGEEKCDAAGDNCLSPYEGGNTGFLAQLTVGHPTPATRGAWNVVTSVRRLETDAVVDAFTDSEFHLGGTNAKGFTLGGSYAWADSAWLSWRWLSATEVTGAPFANDVYQVELNARF